MSEKNNRELTLVREFDAPRELVFKAWTDPTLVEQWWGPLGVSNPVCEVDARPGGKINIVMLAGEELGQLKGQRWPMEGTFREVNSPEKLVFTSSAIIDGKPIMDTIVTVILEDLSSKTRQTVRIVVTRLTPEAAGPLSGVEMGWNQTLDKLGEFVKK